MSKHLPFTIYHLPFKPMCGRATLTKKPKELEERLQLTFEPALLEILQQILPTYNIAPTHLHPVVTNEEGPQLQLFKWGLIPSWAKSAAIGSRLINARIETITEKPAFRAIHKRRCLVPLDGFYEWKKEGKTKIPHRIILKKEAIFCAAGIWEKWADEKGEIIQSFTILTQSPNALLASIHNRMPVILSPDQEQLWLAHNLSTKEVLARIVPFPEELMEAYPVSNKVGKVANNDASLIERDIPRQGTLF